MKLIYIGRGRQTQKDPSFETIYEKPRFTRLKPADSTYRI